MDTYFQELVSHKVVCEAMLPHGGIDSLACLREGNPLVSDGSAIFKLATHDSTQFVVHIAPSPEDGQVANHVRNCLELRKRSSTKLSKHILMPVVYGTLNERYFHITPFKHSLHETAYFRLSKRLVRPQIMRWISLLAGDMLTNTKEDATISLTYDLLVKLAALPKIQRGISIEIDNAIKALDTKTWRPTITVDHNDLWCGNFLYENLLMHRFYVIDWGGANLNGYGIHDLICCGQSFGLSKKAIQDCIIFYCQTTHIQLRHCRFQYLSSLAHLYSNLNQFSEERFMEKINSEIDILSEWA